MGERVFPENKPMRETDGPVPPLGKHIQLTFPLEQPIIYYRVRPWSLKPGDDYIKGVNDPATPCSEENTVVDIFPEAPSLSLNLIPE